MSNYRIEQIRLDDGTRLFIEVEDVVVEHRTQPDTALLDEEGFPVGAERTSRVSEHLDDALSSIEKHVRAFSSVVRRGFEASAPDEFTLEFQIGFKGTASPIPVVLSGEASGALKVTAKWKSNSQPQTKNAR